MRSDELKMLLDGSAPLSERVIDFVAAKTQRRRESITEGSSFHTMGIDGDDAIEFMEDFQEVFGVDLSGFEPRAYFGPEAAVIIPSWRRPQKSLTVALLIQAARDRKWPQA